MRIALTLQSLNHLGGIGIYTQQIVKHLLEMDRSNEYLLIYPSFGQSHKSLGQYSRYQNVTEILSKSAVPHAHYWDHFVVPREARKYRIDLLFNPFLSIPIWGDFKKVLIMHNSEWFTMPDVFWAFERVIGGLRMKAMMKAADRIISISNVVTDDCVLATGLPKAKFRTIYHGVGDEFRQIDDDALLASIKEKYQLPERFLLFVGGIYPQKNFGGLVEAFHLMAHQVPHQLVVAGPKRWKYEEDLKLIQKRNLGDRVQFLGWVDPKDIPPLYNLADCFVYPSFYEGFGLCLIEAMACGCPVVGAAAGALPEVAGDAAVLVDPKDLPTMKEAILGVLLDGSRRQQLVTKGLQRAKRFTWENCARETLALFSELS